jgi:hypothetical protein
MPFSQEDANNWLDDLCPEGTLNIAEMSLRRLRAGIQSQAISFPSQVPVFSCQSRADIQWRLVELYFIHNWSCSDLGQRYGVTMERVRQLISLWVRRAVVLGYLQEIPASDELSAQAAESRKRALAFPAVMLGRDVATDSLALSVSN